MTRRIAMPVGLASSVLFGGGAIIAAAVSGWAWAVFLSLAMILSGLVVTCGTSLARLPLFFALLAVSEFAKRAVFVLPGQGAWSPYLVFLTPYLYFLTAILLPWFLSGRAIPRDALSFLIWALVGLSVSVTWLSPGAPLMARGAATFLLIMPWLIALVARDTPGAINSSFRTLAYFGLASAAMGIVQFIFGPTPIDIAWALRSGEFSIGASHLLASIENTPGVQGVWRPTGLQPDAFTYAMFLMTAFAAAWVAWLRRSMPSIVFIIVGSALVVGIALSLVRGIWLSFAVFIAFAFAARAIPALLRPAIVMSLLIAVLVASQIVGQYLYESYRWYAGMATDPVIARALTTGTVEARLGLWSALGEAIGRYGVLGIGYGSHIWIAHKFLPADARPDILNVHNVMTELLVLVGIPGVLLVLAILYVVFRGPSGERFEADSREKGVHAVIAGYLVAMIVSGFTNGGVFLSFHFFFFAGALHSFRLVRQGSPARQESSERQVANFVSASRLP